MYFCAIDLIVCVYRSNRVTIVVNVYQLPVDGIPSGIWVIILEKKKMEIKKLRLLKPRRARAILCSGGTEVLRAV